MSFDLNISMLVAQHGFLKIHKKLSQAQKELNAYIDKVEELLEDLLDCECDYVFDHNSQHCKGNTLTKEDFQKKLSILRLKPKIFHHAVAENFYHLCNDNLSLIAIQHYFDLISKVFESQDLQKIINLTLQVIEDDPQDYKDKDNGKDNLDILKNFLLEKKE